MAALSICLLVPFWTVLVVRSPMARATCFESGERLPAVVYRHFPPSQRYVIRVAENGPSGPYYGLWVVDFALREIGSPSASLLHVPRSFGSVGYYDGEMGVPIDDPIKMEPGWTWNIGGGIARFARGDFRCQLVR